MAFSMLRPDFEARKVSLSIIYAMRTTFNIGFVCRPSKTQKSGLAPVEMTIVINGARTYLSLPRKEQPSTFKKLTESKKPNELKEYLQGVYNKVSQRQTEMMLKGVPLTAQALKDFIQFGCSDSYTVGQLFDDYLAILKKRVGNDLSQSVYRKYEVARDIFYKYSSVDKNKQVAEINNAVIIDFRAALSKDYQSTSAAGILTKIKTICKFAYENDRLRQDPFCGIKISKKAKDVEFLTEDEVKKIKDKQLYCDRLDKVRDLFLFQCFTGLAYADMAKLTKEDFLGNSLGQTYIKKERCKTRVTFIAVLLPEALEVAKKYDYELPVLSNQKYNAYLKEIKDICGISKPLHTHIGRHTAATYLLNKGLSLETVAKILGHSSTSITKHYAKLLDNSVFKAVANM
jgi:site-specific recombinase XerD